MFSNLLTQVGSLSESFQNVLDNNMPDGAKTRAESLKEGVKYRANSIQEGVMSRIGEKHVMKTACGQREVQELGRLSSTDSVLKVRCLINEKEYALKRMTIGQKPQVDSKEAKPTNDRIKSQQVNIEELMQLADRAEALPTIEAHPNLVHCFAAKPNNTADSHGQLFLFELCEHSLADVLQTGAVTVEDALALVTDLVEGLQVLHSHKGGAIVHGSIEPAHILRGKGGSWKLGSFGATTFSSSDSGSNPDTKMDVWQLGIVLFTVLFGIHPFGGSKEGCDAALKMKSGCALAVPDSRPSNLLEGKLVILLHWLLEPQSSLRPSAKQVAIMLRHIQSMAPSQLIQVLPQPIRKAVATTLNLAEKQALVEGILQLEPSDRKMLVNTHGDQFLLDPYVLPEGVRTGALPVSAITRVRELRVNYGMPDGNLDAIEKAIKECPDLGEMGKELVEASSPEEREALSGATTGPVAPPVDLLDMDDGPAIVSSSPAPQAAAAPMDLLDMGCDSTPATPPAPSTTGDLLDMGLGDAPAAPATPAAPTMGDLLDMGMAPAVPAATSPAPSPSSGDLLDMDFGGKVETSPTATVSTSASGTDLLGGFDMFESPQTTPCAAGYPAAPKPTAAPTNDFDLLF